MEPAHDEAAAWAAQTMVEDGLELVVAPLGGTPPVDRLVLVKPLEAVEAYRAVLARHPQPRLVELGIAFGGSVAFFALAARPSAMVAVDLLQERVALLDQVLADRRLSDVVRLRYGVDQADRDRLRAIVLEELGDDPLDLVIDDASHLYGPTVASFEVLFPLLRPGGEYLIEDWTSDHLIHRFLTEALRDDSSPYQPWARDLMEGGGSSGYDQPHAAAAAVAVAKGGDGAPRPGPAPLSRLAAQLAHGPADPGSGIAEVTINPHWIAVVRSDAPIETGSFDLASACPDPFGTLSALPSEA